ncbi:GNAT family N-acetyltransferase [Paractinoplanes atraurantiacus]|uniref:L-amino acid N-acyltransferase YncA n=1 Tax=Paractinoplanes atraurantiacus TaxID=1036182 RepID=A0A285KKP1_9ACTN|nr:GNAT family N-acetyltransferase [Actinoplanes atraurantiacus]SNY71841.1 L-amino acid N-acyltransferase YncA [Actinoplanes atraurantiacus]
MRVREFEDHDWPAVWSIIREVVEAGDTFTYDPAMSEETAREVWIERPPGRTTVAVDESTGRVLGTAKMGPNRPGPGAHISTASFMVASGARGRGVGTLLCRDALSWASSQPYAGMQFNAVAESNHAAVAVYQRLGFEILGTVPGAFDHPAQGRVGLHLMYKSFG